MNYCPEPSFNRNIPSDNIDWQTGLDYKYKLVMHKKIKSYNFTLLSWVFNLL